MGATVDWSTYWLTVLWTAGPILLVIAAAVVVAIRHDRAHTPLGRAAAAERAAIKRAREVFKP